MITLIGPLTAVFSFFGHAKKNRKAKKESENSLFDIKIGLPEVLRIKEMCMITSMDLNTEEWTHRVISQCVLISIGN